MDAVNGWFDTHALVGIVRSLGDGLLAALSPLLC